MDQPRLKRGLRRDGLLDGGIGEKKVRNETAMEQSEDTCFASRPVRSPVVQSPPFLLLLLLPYEPLTKTGGKKKLKNSSDEGIWGRGRDGRGGGGGGRGRQRQPDIHSRGGGIRTFYS